MKLILKTFIISSCYNVEYELECRDTLSTVPQFEFYFRVVLPKARKDRQIVERDQLGRILASKVPDSPVCYYES